MSHIVLLSVILLLVNLSVLEALSSYKEDLVQFVSDVPPVEDTILLAQIVFRHGHRTPTHHPVYQKNPYKYSSYWPYNSGELLKDGMRISYRLGLELRQRYGKFLGGTYNSHLIGGLSSATSRCEESLQCTLAGLFPPSEDEKFLDDLQWRPISYDVLPRDKDDTFQIFECPNFWDILPRPTNRTFLDLLEYFEIHGGRPMETSCHIYGIADTIFVQKQLNKPQPKWIDKVYPEPLSSVGPLLYSEILERRYEIGTAGLYKRITALILDKLNGTLSPPRRKMMLYSGHDLTVVYALGGVKAYNGEKPNYGSYVAFELHFINQTYGIKMFLQNQDSMKLKALNILGHGEFCPLEKFLSGVKLLTERRKLYCEY